MHLITIVIPVYRGAQTLPALLDEIKPFTQATAMKNGESFRVAEVILVHDGAVDDSATVMQRLASELSFVTPIWLSRNFGQHPATLAGMAASSSAWVVTMDEDGQHDPRDIEGLLTHATATRAQLVYGIGRNAAPHGVLRNAASRTAKWVSASVLGLRELGRFSSFRLINGEIARSLAAYAGHNTYLDVAFSWVVGRVEVCPVTLRSEGNKVSGYNLSRLLSHFGRLVLTSGTRPLRMVSLLGTLAILISLALGAYAVWIKLAHSVPVQGWTSLVVLVSFFGGCTLFALGVIAEYLGMALSMAIGKPPYLVVARPVESPPPKS